MREIGNKAEAAVAKFLHQCGYKIVERNFACKFGEIDIIAEKDEYLVFVAVPLRLQSPNNKKLKRRLCCT